MNGNDRYCDNCAWDVLYGEDSYCIEDDVKVDIPHFDSIVDGDVWCRRWSPCTEENLRIRNAIIERNRGRWNDRVYEGLVGPIDELGKMDY